MELHDSMHNSLISSLARKVDQLQFAAFDEKLANEDLVDFTPLPESVSQVCFFRVGASSDTSCVCSSGLSWAVCVRPKGRVTEHDQWATATGLSLDGLYCYL